MQHTEGKFKTTDGLDLYYQAWLPEAAPKATFAVVHGYGEHSGRYLNPANYFVPQGYAIYAYDLRGHGKSPGARGYINRFDEYLSDTDAFLKLVRREQPGTVFLLGHSLGGLISASYARDHLDLPGLILSSPFLRLKMPVPGWKMLVGRTLSNLVPAYAMPNDIPATMLSHDPAIAAYDSDTLNHHVATARFSTEFVTAQERAMARAGEIKMPVLLMVAGQDQIADPAASAEFFHRLTVADKTVHCYEGYYHEIFNETGKEAVFRDMEAWLQGRV